MVERYVHVAAFDVYSHERLLGNTIVLFAHCDDSVAIGYERDWPHNKVIVEGNATVIAGPE